MNPIPRNAIQFQKGLSEPEFNKLYSKEELCFEALEKLRWPNGFHCPACGHDKAHRLTHRRLLQGSTCRAQISETARTIFHATKLPLSIWPRGIYHLTQSKNGVSAMELMRRLHIGYNSAWLMKQKLILAMKERESNRKLSGPVKMDRCPLSGR